MIMAENNKVSSADDILTSYHLPSPKPLWLNAAYARHIVRGNFMALSARPKTVELGEWIAHQGNSNHDSTDYVTERLTLLAVVEHWRTLVPFVRLVHDKDDGGQTICNHQTCPRMSAGPFVYPFPHPHLHH